MTSFSSLPVFSISLSFSRLLLNRPLFSGPTSIFILPFPREESCWWRRLGDLLLVTMATLSKAWVKQAHACCLSRTCLVFSLYSPSASAPLWFTYILHNVMMLRCFFAHNISTQKNSQDPIQPIPPNMQIKSCCFHFPHPPPFYTGLSCLYLSKPTGVLL